MYESRAIGLDGDVRENDRVCSRPKDAMDVVDSCSKNQYAFVRKNDRVIAIAGRTVGWNKVIASIRIQSVNCQAGMQIRRVNCFLQGATWPAAHAPLRSRDVNCGAMRLARADYARQQQSCD